MMSRSGKRRNVFCLFLLPLVPRRRRIPHTFLTPSAPHTLSNPTTMAQKDSTFKISSLSPVIPFFTSSAASFLFLPPNPKSLCVICITHTHHRRGETSVCTCPPSILTAILILMIGNRVFFGGNEGTFFSPLTVAPDQRSTEDVDCSSSQFVPHSSFVVTSRLIHS